MKSRIFKKILVIAALVVLLLALTISVAAAAGGNYYTVHRGDTLFSIGRMYGVNPYRIAEVNGLANPNCIYAGQVLYIPEGYYDGGYYDGGCYNNCYNPIYDGGYGSNYHRVARGETLTSIAYYYGVSPWAIARLNGIYDLDRIYVGQKLRIPSGGYGWDGGYGRWDGGYGQWDGGYDYQGDYGYY